MGNAMHLQIKTHPPYTASKLLGTILLKVSKEKYDCEELRLKIEGKEVTRCSYTKKKGDDEVTTYITNAHTFLDTDYVVADFRGCQVTKGEFEFPFEVNLPPGLPPSLDDRDVVGEKNYSFRFKIEYTIQARLHRSGWTSWDVQSPVYSFYQPGMQLNPSDVNFPTMLVPRADPVLICCCMDAGSMIYGGAVSTTHVSPNGKLDFRYVLNNQSTSSVKCMNVRIEERVDFHASGNRKDLHHHFTRITEENKIPLRPEDIAAVAVKQSGGSKTGEQLEKERRHLDNEMVQSLANMLSSTDCGSVTFNLPSDLLQTYRGKLIQVSLRLVAEIEMKPFCALPLDDLTCDLVSHATLDAAIKPPPKPEGEQPMPSTWQPVTQPIAVLDTAQAPVSEGKPVELRTRANLGFKAVLPSAAVVRTPDGGVDITPLLEAMGRCWPIAAGTVMHDWAARLCQGPPSFPNVPGILLTPIQVGEILSKCQRNEIKLGIAFRLAAILGQHATPAHVLAAARATTPYRGCDDSSEGGIRFQVARAFGVRCASTEGKEELEKIGFSPLAVDCTFIKVHGMNYEKAPNIHEDKPVALPIPSKADL